MVADAEDLFNGDVTAYGLLFLTCISKHESLVSLVLEIRKSRQREIRDSNS